jgi:hypothetical protein
MVNLNRFYTYAYLREDRTPYYIGKGQGNRAYKSGRRSVNPPKDKLRIIFLKQNITEQEAFRHEIYMIAVFGRKDLGTGILHNKTNGGEGSSGLKFSDESKRKLSDMRQNISEETRQKRSISLRGNSNRKGKPQSEETKAKISAATKADKNPNYGKHHSKESKEKMSEARRGDKNHNYGKPLSGETKAKISAAKKGSTHSDETKAKMSASQKKKRKNLN